MQATSDYLNLTVPRDSGDLVKHAVHPMLTALGGFERFNDLWDVDHGTVKFSQRHAVSIMSLSGRALALIRANDLLSHFLHSVHPYNPRVSTLDMFVDCKVAGADVIPELYAKFKSAGVSLTRKRTTKIKVLLKPNAQGRDTGTIYIGDRATHEVSARVYDKQAERVENGHADPGPLTRYEITARGAVDASLRDVFDPTSLFYHFADPELLPRPSSVPSWVRTPFERTLPELVEHLPYDRLKRLIEASPDVARMLSIGHEMPGGEEVLVHLIRKAFRRGSGELQQAIHPSHSPPSIESGKP